MYGWLKYIIDNLRLFEFCNNPQVVPHMKYKSLPYKAFVKYTEKLVGIVEPKIKNMLQERFLIMYDEWFDSETYFVATLALYTSNAVSGYDCHLLCFSPLENGDDYYAREHKLLLRFLVGLFEKHFLNVVAIIVDSCTTNRLLSGIVNLHSLDCASHRLNNAVKEIIKEIASVIDNIKRIISNLCFPVRRAKLRK